MTIHHLDRQLGSDRRSGTFRMLVKSGLWLRAGFVALCVEVIALIMLATGEATAWTAIAVAVVAGVIARWSWHRARLAFDSDAAETNDGALSAVPVETRPGRVEIAASR